MLKPETTISRRPIILILEDDLDQLQLFVKYARREIRRFRALKTKDQALRQSILACKVVGVSNIDALKKAGSRYEKAIVAILDCNSPDTRGGAAHDQFVKTKHVITGQHKAVDLVSEYFPGTPITLVSSMGRFARIVEKFYSRDESVNVSFISKDQPDEIPVAIRQHLQKFLLVKSGDAEQ